MQEQGDALLRIILISRRTQSQGWSFLLLHIFYGFIWIILYIIIEDVRIFLKRGNFLAFEYTT